MKNIKPLISLFMLTAVSTAFANPQGFQPLAGDANISFSDHQTLEVTTGQQSIIQWDTFSIDASETTRFVMPNSKSTVLNRVLGGKLSEIMGTLEANGMVFLINPKGVLVGEDAHVNTASFIASSFDVLNDEFIKGGDLAFKGTEGSIINLGTITALDGDVIMIGLQVSNEGIIEASEGVAALAAGTEIYLRPDSDEKILVRSKLSDVLANVGIENRGLITALQTELKADGNIYSIAIKDSGKIDALTRCRRLGDKIYLVTDDDETDTLTRCRRLGNKIYLEAESGNIETSGELTAQGGEIRLLGNSIAVLNDAHINVSSENQGGSILIGGDYKGSNPDIINASYVRIEEKALVEADAFLEGNGGRVIVWADHLNSFFGTITARGGETSGHGGFVEVSSKGLIVPVGDVNTLAAHGDTGTLLLDPCAVTITAPPALEGGFAAVPVCPTMTNPVSFNFSSNASSTIYASRIQSLLSCTNVVIDASATGAAATGSITVLSPISWATANTLTLTATDVSSVVQFESNVTSIAGSLIVNADTVVVGDALGLNHAVGVNVRNVTMNITDSLLVQAGTTSNASAQISGFNVNLDIGGDLNIGGGSASGAYGAIKASGTVPLPCSINTLVGGSIFITAGSGTSSSAAITSTNGSIVIGTIMDPVGGSIELTGSSTASYANAYISALTSGGIDVVSNGDVLLQAGVQQGANANIFTQGSDNYDCHINITTNTGDVVLLGGGAT
ncbi:MAG: filamentous hemagglutinin N-terminal domain-containing protein [Chlamydiota bacterium]